MTHSDLLETEATSHQQGWTHYMPRLQAMFQGGDLEGASILIALDAVLF